MKYILAIVAAFIAVAVALFVYSYYEDQKNFGAAKNECERGCIQDSGGIDQCRQICAPHPGHYP